MCLALSTYENVLFEGLILTIVFLFHNEINLGSHWVLRNVCNAIGYAAFNAGAAAMACSCASLIAFIRLFTPVLPMLLLCFNQPQIM